MRVKVSELSGSNLDWAVAVAIGAHCQETGSTDLHTGKHWAVSGFRAMRWDDWTPSTDWSQGGPLIERFRIDIIAERQGLVAAYANDDTYQPMTEDMYGPTPLIAACRAIVSAKLGDEIDLPEGLV